MILIIEFTCPPTMHFKFITECNKCSYKVRQLILLQRAMVCYFKVRQLFFTKCVKCFYKVRQVLRSATIIFRRATGITKCDRTAHPRRPRGS